MLYHNMKFVNAFVHDNEFLIKEGEENKKFSKLKYPIF